MPTSEEREELRRGLVVAKEAVASCEADVPLACAGDHAGMAAVGGALTAARDLIEQALRALYAAKR